MAASFRFGEGDSPGGRGGLSTKVRIAHTFDLAAADAHYTWFPRFFGGSSFLGRQVMWEAYSKRCAALFGFLLVSLLGPAAWGDETRLSISGYDPVAYFTDGKPVLGSSEFEYVARCALAFRQRRPPRSIC